MAPHNISLPDAKLHLEKLAQPLSSLTETCVFEIRSIKEGEPTLSWRIDPLDPNANLGQVLAKMAELNVQGYNIYTTVNPANSNGPVGKACSRHDIIAATYLFLDADDEGIAKRIVQDDQLPYDFIIVTGTKPFLRAHFYIQLEKPTQNLTEWYDLMDAIIKAHSCDVAAKDPSRVMRLAGFISHPSKRKILKGYTTEQVKIYSKGDNYDFL